MKIRHLRVSLSVFLLFSGIILMQAACFAEEKIEVFVAGKKFTSFDSYEKKKEKDLLDAGAAIIFHDQGLKPASGKVPDQVKAGKVVFDPMMGKTVIIASDGTAFSSEATLDTTKTIEIPSQGRVAGVEPSFKQLEEDFDNGKAGNGVEVRPVGSTMQLEEELSRKLRAQDKPVLVISDKTKVRVMELQEKPLDGK